MADYQLRDGGMGSRKFWLTIITMAFSLIGGPVICWLVPSVGSVVVGLYPAYVGAILTANGVYQGANLANKWIVLKNGQPEEVENPVSPEPSKES